MHPKPNMPETPVKDEFRKRSARSQVCKTLQPGMRALRSPARRRGAPLRTGPCYLVSPGVPAS